MRVRVEHVERDAAVGILDDAHVLAPQLARVPQAARVRDHVDLAGSCSSRSCATRRYFSSTTSPRCRRLLCVVTPVGQVLVWQRSAWMQPSENMKPRAVLMKSAPTHSAQAACAEVTSLPAATTRIRLFRSGLDQRIDHPRQRFRDRQAHVVGQRLRRGPAAALAAVDHEEIRRALQAAPQYRIAQLVA